MDLSTDKWAGRLVTLPWPGLWLEPTYLLRWGLVSGLFHGRAVGVTVFCAGFHLELQTKSGLSERFGVRRVHWRGEPAFY